MRNRERQGLSSLVSKAETLCGSVWRTTKPQHRTVSTKKTTYCKAVLLITRHGKCKKMNNPNSFSDSISINYSFSTLRRKLPEKKKCNPIQRVLGEGFTVLSLFNDFS